MLRGDIAPCAVGGSFGRTRAGCMESSWRCRDVTRGASVDALSGADFPPKRDRKRTTARPLEEATQSLGGAGVFSNRRHVKPCLRTLAHHARATACGARGGLRVISAVPAQARRPQRDWRADKSGDRGVRRALQGWVGCRRWQGLCYEGYRYVSHLQSVRLKTVCHTASASTRLR